jgi:mono/diheme cytochrome c family protein/plastocyanin
VASSWLSGARKFAPLLIVFIPAILIGLQQPPPTARGLRIVDVVAAVPEAGGFQPDSVTVYAGQRVRLRFRSADTTHGVAIGPGLGIDLGDLAPGEVRAVDVTFPEAGTFTFYCNKWCSPNHWRMRGVIAAENPRAPESTPQRDPVIENLATEGIDIDAYLAGNPDSAHGDTAHGNTVESDGARAGAAAGMPTAAETQIATQPSAVAGAALIAGMTIPSELENATWRQRHTPLDGEALLLSANPQAEQSTVANVVAYLWLGRPQAAELEIPPELAATLYAKNCAACHGDNGDGQGFDAASAPVAPPSFADAQRMATRRGDVLYAKIRRGGMGTGMPNFGTLFTPDETWELVDYLWRLAFDR